MSEAGARRVATACFNAAVASADPHDAVTKALDVQRGKLRVGGREADLELVERIWVLASGKAAGPMTAAAEEVLGDWIAGGVAVTKRGHNVPLRQVRLLEGGHPIPDGNSLRAGERMLQIASGVGPRDLVLHLISGGASSMVEALRPPLAFDDLEALTVALLRSGAPIGELNTVRKHISRLKGGNLAVAAQNAHAQMTLILSDVVGLGPDAVGSGPSLPDTTRWPEVLEIFWRRLGGQAPTQALWSLLDRASRGEEAETPGPRNPAFSRSSWQVVGSVAMAVDAAAAEAASLGYRPLVLTTALEGEARDVGRMVAAIARECRERGRPAPPRCCLVFGGETTVTVRGEGKGGRNQELALSAALALEGVEGVVVASLATDGGDGPTDAAGAIVDGMTTKRARAAGVDPLASLFANDAYRALEASGALVKTGPTRTNVNDLVLVFVDPRPDSVRPKPG